MDISDKGMKRVLKDPHRCLVANVTDLESCQEVVSKVQPDVIYYTVAMVRCFAWRQPHQWPIAHKINVQGLIHMLEASAFVDTFIFTSSSSVVLHKDMIGNGKYQIFIESLNKPRVLAGKV